jgi:DNA modification methylase
VLDGYREFLEAKRQHVEPVGFAVESADICPQLFPWQSEIVRWALRRGRAALFADCGLGKTPMQLEWARHVPGRVLILAPLAVAEQTCREGAKFGIPVAHKRDGDDGSGKIVVTNYERLHLFKPDDYVGIVLDESSILKAYDGATRKELQAFAETIRYRLCCTATPAPNDLLELVNHAEFLDVMRGKEIMALFFRQDGNSSHAFRLKGHARADFWRWLAEWSVAVRKPSDIGYDDGRFVLPPLNMHSVVVSGPVMDGWLLPVQASTLIERRQARRGSLSERVSAAAGLANGNREPWLVWCDLNDESSALAKAIPDAIEVRGSDTAEHKEDALLGFAAGKYRVLVTKPSIAGWGMNWQHCANVVFVGLSDSYEQFYQAVRRCWRFGQTRPVDCHVITSDADGAVVENIRRKEHQASEMFAELVREMAIYEEVNRQQGRNEMAYRTDEQHGATWRMMLGDSCERLSEIAEASVGLSVFSPPFPGMYAYTNSARDVGNCPDLGQLLEHFRFLMVDLLRVTMPGRCCCVHLTQEPVFKGKDGFIGLRDFRGDCIRAMQAAGWHYYSEVTIDKNPMLKASRTKESTLLFRTLAADSAGSRPALADYLLVFRKSGDNPVPIMSGQHARWNPSGGWITADEWCEWASPVWYRAMPTERHEHQPWQGNYPSRHQASDGIRETDVLSPNDARDGADEKHLCPLQLGVIERCVKLWSAPGDLVLSPFGGIGSEGYVAIGLGRRFVGVELKESYWRIACRNLAEAERKASEAQSDLFSLSTPAPALDSHGQPTV